MTSSGGASPLRCPARPGVDSLKAYAANPSVLAQPLNAQDAIFATVDQCVTPEGYASIAAPGLVAAGASETSADCYFRTIRDDLGSAGLYAYFVGIDGASPDTTTSSATSGTDEAGTDPAAESATSVSSREAERVISRTYRTCGIDRARLATTTTTEAPTTTEAATTSSP